MLYEGMPLQICCCLLAGTEHQRTPENIVNKATLQLPGDLWPNPSL